MNFMVYDVAHNTAKLETYVVGGVERSLLIHRKGATRAFGSRMSNLPFRYQKSGQPVIIGGSMETGSYLLTGVATGDQTFFSTAHDSGHTMSLRSQLLYRICKILSVLMFIEPRDLCNSLKALTYLTLSPDAGI